MSTSHYQTASRVTATTSNWRFGPTGYGKKATLRLSSSLQDLSTYNKINPEDDNLDHVTDSSNSRAIFFPGGLQRETAGSSFSKEKGLPPSPFKRKKWLRIAAVIFCIFLLILLFYIYSANLSTLLSPISSQYSVILDSGSTGTRVYVYEWLPDNSRHHGNLPLIVKSLPEDPLKKPIVKNGRAYRRMETEPGLHKLVHNSSGLKSVIKPLLQWAEKQIPRKAHRTTPLYLYATAGLRRLPSANSKWLLDNAFNILKGSSFTCHKDWVKIISGMEEAYYGWIALNYHMKTLGFGKSKSTFGSLDLGGSSLQVTFETRNILHDKTSLNLSIGAAKHHLSAYSLSGYGLNDAFDKSVALLLKKHFASANNKINEKIVLGHPCLQTGYREQYACPQCAGIGQGGSLLGGGKSIAKNASGYIVELYGLPHWEDCVSLARSTVNLSEWLQLDAGVNCSKKPCALSDDLPEPYGQFFAMSGFYVVFKFFNLHGKASLDDVLRKGHEFCQKTWEVARNSVTPQPFIEQYCFRAPYIVSILREGLHIDDKKVVIGSGSITWTLGVALTEAGNFLSRTINFQGTIFPQKFNPTFLAAIVLVSLVLTVLIIYCTGKGNSGCFRGAYLPLIMNQSGSISIFRFRRWSPINSGFTLGRLGDARVKTPLSPTVSGTEQRPFGIPHGLNNGNINLIESLPHPPSSGVAHSFSTSSLGQIQLENSGGSSWAPHRSQMQLSSRRSQSREDLSSSLAEAHMVKV